MQQNLAMEDFFQIIYYCYVDSVFDYLAIVRGSIYSVKFRTSRCKISNTVDSGNILENIVTHFV